MIKLSQEQIQTIIKEEMMRGLPDFVLRESTNKFIDELRQHIKRFVLSQPGDSSSGDRRRALGLANQALDELEEEVHRMLETKLFQFLQTV